MDLYINIAEYIITASVIIAMITMNVCRGLKEIKKNYKKH